MSATISRPRGLSFATQAKVDKIMIVKAKRDRLQRAQATAWRIVDALERAHTAKCRAAIGADGESHYLLDLARTLALDLDEMDLR